jgi:4-amino-4-deoxy-L-arabinose transferase-like glycosyltransferase
MQQRDRKSSLLLILALAFALLGQFYFIFRREYVWDGVLFWTVAILALMMLLARARRLERGRTHRRALAWLSEHPLRTLTATGGMTLSLLVGWLARQRPDTAGFADLLWLWIIGVALFLLTFILPTLASCNLQPATPNLQTYALAVLLVIALLVRTYDLAHIPANLGGDEGTQGVAALELVERPLGNPFSTGWYSVPTMSFLAYGLSMRVFGATVTGLRMLSALIGAATVLTTFLLARDLWGERVAWLSGIMLTVSHFHIHFSRLGSNQIFDGFFMTLALWLLVRGLRSRDNGSISRGGSHATGRLKFALTGATIGAGWYGYFGARLVGIVAACYLGWRAVVEHRFLARYGRDMLVMACAALVVVAPLLLHYTAHPETMASRFNQVSIFASGWLAREQAITGRSAASLLLQQLWKSISAFNYTLDPTFWYRPQIPLLDFFSGILFIIGLVWSMAENSAAHWRWPANGLLLLWFWLAIILGWVLTENPPSSMRMTVIAPALAIFVSLGLNWLMELKDSLKSHVSHLTAYVLRFTLYSLLLAIVFLNLYYYFLIYTPTRIYGNPNAEVATELGRYLREQDDKAVAYFYGPPFMYWDFGTLRFLARDVEGVNVPPVGEDDPPLPNPGQSARFIFLPERLDELETIRARYPRGEVNPVRSKADGRLLYVLYEWRMVNEE